MAKEILVCPFCQGKMESSNTMQLADTARVRCKTCSQPISLGEARKHIAIAMEPEPESAQEPLAASAPSTWFVELQRDGDVHMTCNTPHEGHLVRAEIKRLRGEVKLRIRANTSERRQVAASYRSAKASVGPTTRRRGAIRFIQQTAKAGIVATYESQLRQLAEQRALLDKCEINLAHADAQVQAWLSQHF